MEQIAKGLPEYRCHKVVRAAKIKLWVTAGPIALAALSLALSWVLATWMNSGG